MQPIAPRLRRARALHRQALRRTKTRQSRKRGNVASRGVASQAKQRERPRTQTRGSEIARDGRAKRLPKHLPLGDGGHRLSNSSGPRFPHCASP
eukprot:5341050-Alexandrium_andersonii.AAC.1